MTGRSAFARALAERQPDPAGRRWLFVPYDQLTDRIGPLAAAAPRELGIVVVESEAKGRRRPYHKQKLALVLANLRQFALEQASRGVAVRHVAVRGGYAEALEPLVGELGPLTCMEPAERELRVELAPLVATGAVQFAPHAGWLTTAADFAASHPDGPPWRMDRFYRHVRRSTGVLVERGRPVGGKWSFDTENRSPWRGEPASPTPLRFRPDAITSEVLDLVAERFAQHPGELDGAMLPATAADAAATWSWAQAACLADFGRFQDAMAWSSPSLFHTRLAPLLHLHRLLPVAVVRDAVASGLPIASVEGFVRQVLGWREFVRHVHAATDGFRALPDGAAPRTADGAAAPAFLAADAIALPPAYWGVRSGLECLDRVVADVWRDGYGHHITRLMVLANVAALLDVSPRELTDWFWIAYTDAYDWVVEPNVLGMGTFAVGDLMTTKPYVAGAAYVDRMSDYCGRCAFDPKRDCPLRSLYWAFLARHAHALRGNQRVAIPLASVHKRSATQRAADAAEFERVRAALAAGEVLTPSSARAKR